MTVPQMIILARESRQLSQSELADQIGMSRPNMGKIESADIGVKQETLELIAEATHYPVSFFHQEFPVLPEHLVYRKRDRVPQKTLIPITAKVNVQKFQIQRVIELLEMESPILPAMTVNEIYNPVAIARFLRKKWDIKEPVIENMIRLLESNGILVTCFDFGTERVDCRCFLTDSNYPVIVYNKTLLGDRLRFSLAQQLGHLVMHSHESVNWDRDITHEANLFASEFLVPEYAIRKDLDMGISVARFAELKKKWKVSMISLLYRADDLGYFTPNQKKYQIQQFNDLKIRRREPADLDVLLETPQLIRTWLSELRLKLKLDTSGMAALLNLYPDEFIEYYN